jgi:hypothetical protein
MNRIYLLLAAIIGFSTMLRAQSNLGVLDGKVTDGLTKKPVEFATVTIEGGGGTKKSKFTDKDGEFEFTAIPAGQYTISVSFIDDVKLENLCITFSAKWLNLMFASKPRLLPNPPL